MAQTGYTPISIYYSATGGATPTSGNLVAGELAINTADGKLFYKDSAGVVQVIGTKGGVGSSTTTQVLYNSSGLVVGSANMTFNGTTLTLANDASISGLTVGKGGGAVSTNTAVGASALVSNTSGNYSSAFGQTAAYSSSAGIGIAAFGSQALYSSTGNYNAGLGFAAGYYSTGQFNTFVGPQSGPQVATSSGSNIVAVGYQALYSNTTASNNTAVGYQAGYAGTTAAQVTAIGFGALYTNNASYNTAVGYASARSTTTGVGITALGSQTLYSNTTGNSSVAIGTYDGTTLPALYSNTTGSNNIAVGTGALQANTTASNNTAVGYQAGYSNTTGTGCVYLGYQAGYTSNANYNTFIGRLSGNIATGGNNTIIGNNAGGLTTSGTDNTFIGYGAGYNITTGSKNIIVGGYGGNGGGLDIRTASNYIVLSDGDGNPRLSIASDNSTCLGQTTITSTPIQGYCFVGGSGPGMAVGHASGTPSGYYYASFSYNGNLIGSIQQNGTTATSYVTSSDYRLKENIAPMTGALAKISLLKPCTYTWKSDGTNGQGFVAHELQAVVPEAVTGEKDAVNEDGTIRPQGIDTSFLVATLVAAIQELKAEIDTLKGIK